MSLLLECFLLECSSLLDQQLSAVLAIVCQDSTGWLREMYGHLDQGLSRQAEASDILRVVVFLQSLLQLACDFLEEGDLLL